MSKLIVGCGYLGHRVARSWLAAGHVVYAVTRSPARAGQLEEKGLRPIVADVTQPETLVQLPVADSLLYCVGYDRGCGVSKRAVYVDGLGSVLNALHSETQRIIFTSSTGVYGQTDGSWVDENSACQPTRSGGRVMLEAEEVLKRHRLESRAIILRLAGLYGPGRVPRMADVLAGRPINANPGGSLNLIHVDDAVEVVRLAESRAQPPRTYVVSDGHPSQRRAFYGWLAELLSVPRPEFAQPSPETGDKDWGMNDKRVRNARMLNELGVALQCPSYREGLQSIVATQASDNPATD